MSPRLRTLAGLGLLYVVLKWSLVLSLGAWAIDRGRPELLLGIPLVAVPAALLIRRLRRPSHPPREVLDGRP